MGFRSTCVIRKPVPARSLNSQYDVEPYRETLRKTEMV